MNGSGTARSQEEWLPTTFRFCGARDGPRHWGTQMGLCAREGMNFAFTSHGKRLSGMGMAPNSNNFRTMSKEVDHICVVPDDELENDFKDAWADVGTKKSLAALKER